MIGVYIIYSHKIDTFYIGITHEDIEERIQKHNIAFYGKKFTAQSKDWELFHFIECNSVSQTIKIEKHIKAMKSRKYIQNLKIYPDISAKLLEKYST
ncbi:MAG: GIY-YIG nuclease family protein [Chitinophagales bacterium]|nr:GIY-YIG nuclease family protein [Chitinophagales bacterium]